jgi:hypothetical protein
MDLEQLRRQAKELVRAVRAGDPDEIARLGDLPPRLASAQLVLAREHGYASWPALVHGASPDYAVLVESLGTTRWQTALDMLMTAGSVASDAVRIGLRHDDPKVRRRCLYFLDHHLDQASLPALFDNLEHRDGRVRTAALHALACDECKEGDCRPHEEDVIPIALSFLRSDRSRRVRTGAASLLGLRAPRLPEVARALEHARDHDPHPVVRSVAGWYAPGGINYRKIAARLSVPPTAPR